MRDERPRQDAIHSGEFQNEEIQGEAKNVPGVANRYTRRRLAAILSTLALPVIGGMIWRSRVNADPMPPPIMPLAYEFVPSPNFDDRPINTTVSCLVLHSTVEPTTEGTIGIFLDPARKVSAHFVVGKDGRVVQMVPIEKRAWHAGASVLEGVPKVNDYSVGIEMVNLNDGKDPYTEPQILAVAGILRFLRSHHDIPDGRVVSHAQIALPPGRKSDPVKFDFDRVRLLARQTADTPLSTILPAVTPPAAPSAPSTSGKPAKG